jgi:Transposase DNA-binding
MLDDAHYWAATQFGSADLGDVRRTGRLVSTMAAIARAPDESLPRQLGSIAGAKAAYRLFDCGAVTWRRSRIRIWLNAGPRRRGIQSC